MYAQCANDVYTNIALQVNKGSSKSVVCVVFRGVVDPLVAMSSIQPEPYTYKLHKTSGTFGFIICPSIVTRVRGLSSSYTHLLGSAKPIKPCRNPSNPAAKSFSSNAANPTFTFVNDLRGQISPSGMLLFKAIDIFSQNLPRKQCSFLKNLL
ncbi:hypothetical protein CEXT_258341 [Caerostris extrusa]|uniref:Uncharacterized protein n=1 Tax=Caerostris extrusa TaxID=172846 RepID=A0AAV4VUC3_CAEEX|nr:hypothetical protein CEXT_258341 [Caerostris extrusa]